MASATCCSRPISEVRGIGRSWRLPGNLRRGQLTFIWQIEGVSCTGTKSGLARRWITSAVNRYPRRGTVLSKLLAAIIQRATQLEGALHQRIVGNEGVGPHRLHQFLFADQPSRVFDEIFEGFIDLRAKLDLLSRLEDTAPGDVQRELAELIVQRTRLQVRSSSATKPGSVLNFGVSLALFRYFPS